MSKIQRLRKKNSSDITLHTESQFYLPGDEIVGTVTYHPKKSVHVRFVKIIFAGEETCVWIEKVAARVGGPVVASKVPLFRKENTVVSDRTRLDASPHTWQFRFYIPRAMPPTCNYNGKTTVSYWIKTKAAATLGHFSARFKLPVIIGQFWVPTIPPPIRINHNTLGGHIEMCVKSSHSVVKCDDVVNLDIHFENTSYKNVAGIRVKLKQVWECTGVFYHKNVVLKYFTKEGYPTGRGSHDTQIQIKIPHRLHLCPTVTNATLFKCTYYLGVYGLTKTAGLVATEAVKCRVPLTITNQPSSEHASETSVGVPRPNLLPQRNPPPARSRHTSDEDESEEEHEHASGSHAHNEDFDFDEFVNLRLRNSQGNFPGAAPPQSGEFAGLSALFEDLEGEWEQLPAEEEEANEGKTKNKQKAKSDAEDEEEHENHAEGGLASGSECIVCYDGPKNMLMLPCAHIATCVSCTSYIMYSNKMCPVCRTKVSQVMRIYPV